jgi:hypothetical protein
MMKKAEVKPLFKNKNRQDIQNYRPISILSEFSKPLEKLMYNRLLLFLKKHNILTSEQHGFTESKSIETASHSFIQKEASGQTLTCSRYFPRPFQSI